MSGWKRPERDHLSSADCWCEPVAHLIQREGLPDGWLYVHDLPDPCSSPYHAEFAEACGRIASGQSHIASFRPPTKAERMANRQRAVANATNSEELALAQQRLADEVRHGQSRTGGKR